MSSEYINAKMRIVKHLPLAALGASAIAWTALFAAAGSHLYNSTMTSGSNVDSALEFLGTWEVMVVAMMLPSSLSFLTLFQTATSGSRSSIIRSVAVCSGYALTWAVVGCVAIMMNDTLYRIESLGVWLDSHANLFAGSVFTLAGCYQFSTLKRRCLTVCSHPGSFFMRHYRRGVGNALALGVRYGFVCLGCCWALMTVMVVLGGGSLYLMMVLTVIMFGERAMGWNDRFASGVGLTCIALGVFLAASPDVMPAFAQNAANWANMDSMQLPHHNWPFWCHV